MNKTAIIIIVLLSLALIASVYISSSNHGYYKEKISDVMKEKARTDKKLKVVTAKSKLDSIDNIKKEADYRDSRLEVERYKKQVNNARKKERDEIQRNKEVIPAFSNIQIDSAFKFMYPRTDSAVYH